MHLTYERSCMACRNKRLKQDMLRVCRINGEFCIDENFKLGGRGAYLCKNNDCLNKAISKKMLNRAFKTNVNEEIYSKLRGYIE